jgi:peroxiredoxin
MGEAMGALKRMPSITLPSTNGTDEPLRRGGTAVFFVYPKSGRPGVEPPPGWHDTPGMTGCTPQSCGFRDLHGEISQHAEVFGISTQVADEQQEFAQRLELPYPVLSDPEGTLGAELGLELLDVTPDVRVYRRVTLITRDGEIVKVFDPITAPETNAADVLAWLQENPT